MKQRVFLSILNLLGFLGTVIVNALANILPINNNTTGELSDMYPNLFVPAGVTFSIWGLIYVLLGIFVVYQLIGALKDRGSTFIENIGPFFFIASLANIGWIFAWHYELVGISLLAMLALLGSLLAVYIRLRVGKSAAPAGERYMVHLPFSVYLGWITIATIANVTALLVDIGWGRFGLSEQFWAAAVITVGIIIALSVLFTRKDIFYCLVVDWALIGILLKRLSVETAPDRAVEIAAVAGIAIISAGIILQLIRRRVY